MQLIDLPLCVERLVWDPKRTRQDLLAFELAVQRAIAERLTAEAEVEKTRSKLEERRG